RQAVVVVLGEWEQKMVKRPRFGDIERHIIPELEAGLPHVQSYILKVTESGKKLGVNVVDLTTELAKKFKVKDGSGLMISKVFSNTAAAKAGFETGDVIVAIGKGKIKNSSDLRAAMAELEEGEEALVHLFREGKRIKIAVVPDVNIEFNDIFNTIQDKLKDLNIDIDGENKIRVREVKRIREHYIKQVKEKLDKNNIERYEERMQKMMEAQEKLNKEMEIMRKLLEEEKKKKK
ncbi:MAG: PDZ domain-containing protein, partial [bacterium]|nr:PDZ domain-containing protein [bacterium]